jgi:hypothetical protein
VAAGRPWSARIAAHEAWPEAVDLVERRGSTKWTRQAGGSSPAQKMMEARWQRARSGRTAATRRRDAALTGNGARLEQCDVGSASMEWAAPDTEAAVQRARTGDLGVASDRAGSERGVLSGPSFSRTPRDKGCRSARPIRAGRMAA